MNDNKNKNIVFLNSPHRHDLISTSCVNKEVINYNNQLREAIKPHPNVKLLEIELSRQHYTRHGLHLNLIGKKLVSQKVALIVEQICKSEKTPISLVKTTLLEDNNLTVHDPNIDDKFVATKCTLDIISQVTCQVYGNQISDNSIIQESNLTGKGIDKEYLFQHQEPLLGNDIEVQNSDCKDRMITDTIVQQMRRCSVKRSTDFLWN